jgi:hypothetical protein
MVKKLLTVVFIGLLTNLFIGQYSPVLSQSGLKLNNPKKNNLYTNKLSLSSSIFDSTVIQKPLVLQPLNSNDIIPQFIVGFGVGSLATIGAALPLAKLTGMSFDPGGGGHTTDFGGMVFFFLLASVQVFATSGLVWAAGTNNKVGSNFGSTLLGSVAGLGLEIGGILLALSIGNNSNGKSGNGTIAWIMALTSLTFPTIGAMIGLNSSRYPKRIYPKSNSLINLNERNVTLSAPSFYLELDKTLHHKPISFAKIISLNF